MTQTKSPVNHWQKQRIAVSKDFQEAIYDVGLNGQIALRRDGKKLLLDSGRSVTEFWSCSYLGLENDPRLAQAAKAAMDDFGVQLAAARTRVRPVHFQTLEAKLSLIFKAPTLTFSTVGLAHLATLPMLGAGVLPSYAISERGVLWILDKKSHASIQILRSAMEQNGPVERIPFEDLNLLEEAFKKADLQGLTPISVSDGIGSMGSNAPVLELLELAQTYGGYAYLDDAHGTSILGQDGGGYVLDLVQNKFHERMILVSSLAKGFGSVGGSVSLANANDIEMMMHYATPYIFGGPPSLPSIAASSASADIHLSSEIYQLQNQLGERLRVFDEKAGSEAINFGKAIPIRGFVVGDEHAAIRIGKRLFDAGFGTTIAMYPTVPKGEAMIRIAISAIHSLCDIVGLVEHFHEYLSDERCAARK